MKLTDVLGGLVKEGRIRAQIPHGEPINLGGEDPQAFAQYVADYDAALDTLLTQGLAAWKVANNKPGLDKVLYTLEPRNPATGRFVSAHLFMTPLSVALHGQDLYKMYQEGTWPGANPNGRDRGSLWISTSFNARCC